MAQKKKKITKKEIQEDQLVTSFYKVEEFVEQHKQNIIIGVAAVAIIALAIVWYNNKKIEDNLQATAEMAKVIPLFEKGSFQEAIEGQPGTNLNGLKSIVENYGSTEQGEFAKIYLADSYYYLGDYTNAKKYYEEYSGESSLHKAAAYAGIAACYEQEGNYEKAAGYYNKAASVSKYNPLTPDYLLNAGINYIKVNKKDMAETVLNRIKKEFKTSPIAREVDKYLAQI
jgi:tetratricopeptide (TPR) repeat protein